MSEKAPASRKMRLDLLLVERGLLPSRERAHRMILAGNVLVNDEPQTKPGAQVRVDSEIRLKQPDHPYVSRGALKLVGALQAFQIPVEGRIGLDVGASTGGFTEVLLERGASKVYAFDVGHNQLDWKIRSDPRVVVREGYNARYLKADDLGEKVDLIVVDVSFISLDKILPALVSVATDKTDWITLIKPQFEVGKENVGKGGIVTSTQAQQEAVERLRVFGETLGLRRMGLVESPIAGTHGNREFLAHWKLIDQNSA